MFVIAEAIIERRSGAFEPAGRRTALAFNMHASVVMRLLESPVTLIEAFDGHRWDSPPKIKFAPDSPLEGSGFEPSVPLPRLSSIRAVRAEIIGRSTDVFRGDREFDVFAPQGRLRTPP